MTRAGLIVPPIKGRVPPDMATMYPGTEVLIEGIGVSALTGAGYAEAEDRVTEAATRLARRGADGIVLFGTSISFHRGAAGNAALEVAIRASSGLPAMTLTSAMEKALHLSKARRIDVATAYTAEVNAQFREYFEAVGFEIGIIDGMDITALDAVEQTGTQAVLDLSRAIWAAGEGAQALVISCAGLTTAEAAVRLEAEIGRPVLSSSMVGAWAAQGLAGGATEVADFGTLYESKDVTWPSA